MTNTEMNLFYDEIRVGLKNQPARESSMLSWIICHCPREELHDTLTRFGFNESEVEKMTSGL